MIHWLRSAKTWRILLLTFMTIFTFSVVMAHPAGDPDGDGLPGNSDDCPFRFGPVSSAGCPVPVDPDGDGTFGGSDLCPNSGGPGWNQGCPVGQEPGAEQAPQSAVLAPEPNAAPPVQRPPNPVRGRPFNTFDEDRIMSLGFNPAPPVETMLETWQESSEEILTELDGLGRITKDGGYYAFRLGYSFVTGQSNLFMGLGMSSPATNFVLGGELTMQSNSGEIEICSLIGRVERDSGRSALTFVDAGLTNTGSAVLMDYTDPTTEASTLRVRNLNLDLSEPHHVLIVARNTEMHVFVDGQEVFHDIEVTPRSGGYGLTMVSRASGGRCEVRNVWAYVTGDEVQ